MDKVSGYIVANSQGGYDVINKTSQTSTKPFVIPSQEEIPDEKTATQTSRDFTTTDYDPFKDYAETGSVKLPGWMNTKTEPTRSDEEILKEIEELAKEHARTGQSINDDEKYLKLVDEYISSVSPDREGILKKSVPEINGIVRAIYQASSYTTSDAYQQIVSQIEEETEYKEKKQKELIDYLIETLQNKGKNNNTAINTSTSQHEGDNGEIIETLDTTIKSDTYSCFVQDGAVKYAEFFDPSRESKGNELRLGESIMRYKEGKWIQNLLPEEVSRSAEASASYKAAYDFACGKYNPPEKYNGTGVLLKQINGGDEFTAKYEAYNRTYEKLRSEIA